MLLPNQSRCRRLQYSWLMNQRSMTSTGEKVLDLGGVADADYQRLLGIPRENLVVWNMDARTRPHALVDLDDVRSLPPFPQVCTKVLAFNLLEHLFHPLELLKWVCRALQPGGQLLVTVPFIYGIHPSPNDYWRMSPQVFQRFFQDLEKSEGIRGNPIVQALAEDYRDGVSCLTSDGFKGGRARRLKSSLVEGVAYGVSKIFSWTGRDASVRKWAQSHPVAIGVLWTKS